jgi:signal peptidase I
MMSDSAKIAAPPASTKPVGRASCPPAGETPAPLSSEVSSGMRRPPARAGKGETFFLKIAVTLAALMLGAWIFSFQLFSIPSGSMIPTLLIGDYVFVSKMSYGFSGYSLPFFHPHFGRIFGRLPGRGDIAVFKLPRDPSIDYIKRIVGLPGDKVQVKEGLLYINGQAATRTRIQDFIDDENGAKVPVRQFLETLPNGVQYPILQPVDNGPLDNTIVYEVPPDHVFVIGDNRDNSLDSRVPERNDGVGFVPLENLVGPAEFRIFSVDGNVPAIRYSRLFTLVH